LGLSAPLPTKINNMQLMRLKLVLFCKGDIVSYRVLCTDFKGLIGKEIIKSRPLTAITKSSLILSVLLFYQLVVSDRQFNISIDCSVVTSIRNIPTLCYGTEEIRDTTCKFSNRKSKLIQPS
jgi:hypothetical protein